MGRYKLGYEKTKIGIPRITLKRGRIEKLKKQVAKWQKKLNEL